MSPIFTLRVVTLTGTTYTFTVTPRTSLVHVYILMQNKTGNHPLEMQFIVPAIYNQTGNNISLPRIEDEGVQRPLSDFNMFQDTTIHLKLRLGRPQPAPYRREDWLPLLAMYI